MKRLLIAHIIKGRAANVINALRKKYDGRTAAAIDAHVTLAGPCDTALTVAEIATITARVASDAIPFELIITGIGTFLPTSSTSFLHIEPKERLVALHDELVAQLLWKEAFPYYPHVTITEYLSPVETSEVVHKLHTFIIHETDMLDTLALLEKGSDGKWVLLREFQLGKRDTKLFPTTSPMEF
jgi:2'-5' RNA ligase